MGFSGLAGADRVLDFDGREGETADVLGLPNRGRIQKGSVADLVAFDPRWVCANATYDDSMHQADDIEHVLIDGEFVVQNGEPTGARPGRVLRSVEEWGGLKRTNLTER